MFVFATCDQNYLTTSLNLFQGIGWSLPPCTIRLLFLWPIQVVSFTFLLAENWPIFLQLHCSGPQRMNFHRILTIKRFRSLRLKHGGGSFQPENYPPPATLGLDYLETFLVICWILLSLRFYNFYRMFEELGNVIFQNFQISFGQIIMERSFSTIVTPIQSH